jgi:putative addiction module CopG family antidote
MNELITEESRRFLQTQIASGRYTLEDEVIEDALRRMRREETLPRAERTIDNDPLWGMFRNEPEMIDQIVEDAMRDRQTIPLRVTADE